eukprot:scaffold2421_cov390-Prasinococcus_capsulatus_cf.AAC.15
MMSHAHRPSPRMIERRSSGTESVSQKSASVACHCPSSWEFSCAWSPETRASASSTYSCSCSAYSPSSSASGCAAALHRCHASDILDSEACPQARKPRLSAPCGSGGGPTGCRSRSPAKYHPPERPDSPEHPRSQST